MDQSPVKNRNHDPNAVPPAKKSIRSVDVRVTGHPLDPQSGGQIIKPGELVDIVEITPLNRSQMVLYNQLLGHSWPRIETTRVHRIRKAVLRGSHESNDRLHEAFDNLMGAWAKIKFKDQSGRPKIARIHLIGENTEEEEEDGYFYYTFPPELITIVGRSENWAKLKSQIMYALRSKYSIRLYEMLEKRVSLKKQSETFTVDEFRALLGVPNGKLPRFGEFNKHCLKPALAEVNQLMDFHVEIGVVKRGRSVEKLTLLWFKKDDDGVREAAAERERSRIGRKARREGRIERVEY
jgi:plasmid replication initiation protein